MLSVEIFKTKVGISFSFFAVVALLLLLEGQSSESLLVVLLCCVLHEMGHILMMCLCSVPPKEVVLYGGGIRISPDRSKMLSENKDALILSAGCVVNILLALITAVITQGVNLFVSANLFLGAFNLMPVKYFDGGRLLSAVLKDSILERIIRYLFIAAFGAVIIVMIYNGFFSVSIIVTFVYIIAAEFLL